MPFKSLQHFISTLENAGELVRIKEFVSPRLEISEIADRIVKNNGKALLFENNGTSFPLLINAFGSEKRMCMALGVQGLDEAGKELQRLMDDLFSPKESILGKLRVLPLLSEISSWMPKRIHGKGHCQEIVMKNPDLTKFPVLTCWPADGGPFITLPVVHTRDPQTGMRNVGMYRMQVFGPDFTGMHWHLHKGSARHFEQYKELGLRMPVSVTLGGDPVYTYVATAPLPEQFDEYLLAGLIRKKKVELVKCLTNDLEVPADADIVIEGYVDPSEELILEGPFGDHTGFYSLADHYPKFHVTCITHRRDAIYPATIVGIPPMEDAWIGKATERIFLYPMRLTTIRELQDMNMPVEGVFHNIVLAKISDRYPGQAEKVMNSLWGAGQMMFNKILIILDGEKKLEDYAEVAHIVSEVVDPLKDIHFMKGPIDILDHSSRRFAFGSKIGIDATLKSGESGNKRMIQDKKISFPDPEKIKNILPEITGIRDLQAEKSISLAILTIKKSRTDQIRTTAMKLIHENLLGKTKFVIFLDDGISLSSLGDIAWITGNNIDPERDCFIIQDSEGHPVPVLFTDATRKTKELDQFTRDWPNIIVMDDATIRHIDSIWEKLNLGPYLPSPSLRFKSLSLNNTSKFSP